MFGDHKMLLAKKLLNTFHGQGGIIGLANDMERRVIGVSVRREPVFIVFRSLMNEALERL